MKTHFKKGDTVKLKSGGPKMTIEFITCFDTIMCVWFDKQEHKQKGTFYEEALEYIGEIK
jgi:uncharacterized protein YodC (DUF2158 family)